MKRTRFTEGDADFDNFSDVMELCDEYIEDQTGCNLITKEITKVYQELWRLQSRNQYLEGVYSEYMKYIDVDVEVEDVTPKTPKRPNTTIRTRKLPPPPPAPLPYQDDSEEDVDLKQFFAEL